MLWKLSFFSDRFIKYVRYGTILCDFFLIELLILAILVDRLAFRLSITSKTLNTAVLHRNTNFVFRSSQLVHLYLHYRLVTTQGACMQGEIFI